MELQIFHGDITTLNVDAIVNAANQSLLGGGGVDGAIHHAAGPDLLKECKSLGGCEVGDAKITKGYRLPAKYVIHTVGPVWHGGNKNESELLASCYQRCLQLAIEHKCTSMAFPCISTGVFGYPHELAAENAILTVKKYLSINNKTIKITFCCFLECDFQIYEHLYLRNANTH
jgi:O-acetyl-ADP-ribose deacetylase (regulator of RNase III)